MYSNVICVGDSYTNEIEELSQFDSEFKKVGYEFKSYPQLLGEHYNCKWETFGQSGMPMVFTLQTLIDKIPYILSLENPLVIYQFGFFSNMILHIEDDKWVNWKSLLSENFLKQQFQSQSKYGVITTHGSELPNLKDKVLLADYTKKFGEQTNYFIIQYFCTITDILNTFGKSNVYGMFLPKPQFKLPKHDRLLPRFDNWAKPEIKEVLPQINDNHKSTEANQKICDWIVNNIQKYQ